MNIPEGLLGTLLVLLAGVVGFITRYFISQVDALEKRIDEVDSKTMQRRETDRSQAEIIMRDLLELRGKHSGAADLWQTRFEMLMEQNRKEHADLVDELKIMGDKVDLLGDCVRKLAAGAKNC